MRIRFDQSISIHSEYIYFLYDLFKDFTVSPPKSTNRKPDKRMGKIAIIVLYLRLECYLVLIIYGSYFTKIRLKLYLPI